MKIPLGILVPENQTNKDEIQKHLSENSYIITVGDRTTEKMIDFDLIPSLQIIDGQEKREKRKQKLEKERFNELMEIERELYGDHEEQNITFDKLQTMLSQLKL